MATTQQNKLALAVLAVALVIWAIYVYQQRNDISSVVTETETATSTQNTSNGGAKGTPQPVGDGLNGYANSEYNFSLRFPTYVRPTNFFSTFHDLPSNWRVNASAGNQGKAVVEFPVYSVDQGSVATGKDYPLFYRATLRVGVSPNVAECYAMDAGYTDQKVTNVTINGIAWKRFDFQNAGMMKYMEGKSYRTIRNNMCYVLEQIKHGSNYRDDTMKPGTADTTLTNYYNIAGDIVKTFKFTK